MPTVTRTGRVAPVVVHEPHDVDRAHLLAVQLGVVRIRHVGRAQRTRREIRRTREQPPIVDTHAVEHLVAIWRRENLEGGGRHIDTQKTVAPFDLARDHPRRRDQLVVLHQIRGVPRVVVLGLAGHEHIERERHEQPPQQTDAQAIGHRYWSSSRLRSR
ncbi:hypothetical protein OKW50_005548 [Paraburkholderia youngii]